MRALTVDEGQRFGRLVAVTRAEPPDGKVGQWWSCACDCGRRVLVRAYVLHRGGKTGCGCVPTARRHGHARRSTRSRAYVAWQHMWKRCSDPRNENYPNYGGRGIAVCERWRDFTAFLEDLGDCAPGLTIDRIDNDGHYEPGNVRWATRKEQQRNKSTTMWISAFGKRQALAAWAEETGLTATMIRGRIVRRGWPVELALTAPSGHRR